jgi:hypothetical protein
LSGQLVDRLPLWLWHDGNLYDVPGGDLHFCVDHPKHSQEGSVRTIEFARTGRGSRTIAYGIAPFPFDHPDLEPLEKDDVPTVLSPLGEAIGDAGRDELITRLHNYPLQPTGPATRAAADRASRYTDGGRAT